MSGLVERVEAALDDAWGNHTQWTSVRREMCQAVIPIILAEAVKVAREYVHVGETGRDAAERTLAGEEIATAIAALGEGE